PCRLHPSPAKSAGGPTGPVHKVCPATRSIVRYPSAGPRWPALWNAICRCPQGRSLSIETASHLRPDKSHKIFPAFSWLAPSDITRNAPEWKKRKEVYTTREPGRPRWSSRGELLQENSSEQESELGGWVSLSSIQ